MQKRSKARRNTTVLPPPIHVEDRAEVVRMIAELFEVLNNHRGDPTDALLSLLAAYIEGCQQVLRDSPPDEVEENRDVMLGMLEHAQWFVTAWPDYSSARPTVH